MCVLEIFSLAHLEELDIESVSETDAMLGGSPRYRPQGLRKGLFGAGTDGPSLCCRWRRSAPC